MQPYLLEKERLELERMSAYERNAALNRIAAANEANARAISQAAAASNNGFRTMSPNAAPYGPYGVLGMPAVQGTPNFNLNTADVYNRIGGGGLSFP
jgi:hypothetical protein